MIKATYSEGNNVGGLRSVLMALFYNVISVQPLPVRFKNGEWEEMEFLPESASCNEDIKDTDNGPQYTYTISLAFNKQSQDLYNAFLPYLGQVGIVQYTDNNGLTRLLGTLNNRVTVSLAGRTGSTFATANDLTITITWVNNKPAPLV